MRLVLLLAAFLAAQLASAQSTSKDFKEGTYILSDSRNVRRQGLLKLSSYNKLLVKNPDGKTSKLTPAQVPTFWLNGQQYVTAGNFIGTRVNIKHAFVAQIDSGQAVLMRYDYEPHRQIEAFGPMVNGYSGPISHIFLLKAAANAQITRVERGIFSPGGKMFREAVRPYFSSRPDLIKMLDENLITFENLPAAIHSLNNNLPLTPPAAPNMD